MIYTLPFNKLRKTIMIAILPVLAVSCGSYQQASYYDNDGIYSDGTIRTAERPPQQGNRYQQNQESNTYSDYFGQKANQYDEILDGEIFTDVDSYSSQIENDSINQVDQGQLTDYYNNANDYQGYGGWGDNTTSVSINYYNNGWGGFAYADPWLWNNWGWGYNTWNYGWGWNNPWRWNRWNNWGWGGFGGFGWNNWGWGGGFGWGGYGYGWNNWGYGYGWNNGFNRNRYAYINGRRGYYNRNIIGDSRIATSLRGRSNVNTRGNSPRYRSTAARSSSARYSSSTARSNRNYQGTTRRTVGVDQNRAYRTSRSTRAVPRYNNSSRSNSTYRSSASASRYRPGTSSSARTATPRTSAYRSSGSRYNSAGRSSGSYRSSGSSSRSSGYRSSGSSSRSSGSYRSSGSSSRSSGSVRSSSGGSRSSGSSGRSSSGRSGGRRQ